MRSPALLALTFIGVVTGCSFVIDARTDQCSTDDDCARFEGTTCSLSDRVCVRRVDAQGGTSGTPAVVPGRDAAEQVQRDAGATVMPPVDAAAAADGPIGTPDPCLAAVKPVVQIDGDISASDRLTCDKSYLLVGLVFVKAGVTLTIEPGTTLYGDVASKGALVVQPGARLVADGMPDRPIVFTSPKPAGQRAPGDWGGLILLGKAPVNAKAPTIEGITTGGEYGGAVPDDDSGVLRYVRIEYSGTKIGPNNEINGVTFGGVGSKTVVDYVQVRHTADDCFEFFGGTVNAKHLACQWNGDDGIDWDLGYRGKLQFVVLQQNPSVADTANGFEGDNDALGTLAEPRSEPVIYNATLCGQKADVPEEQYGLLLRKSTRAQLYNIIVTGFEAGLDVRDATTAVALRHSILFGNLARNVAYAEDGSNTTTEKNDDGGFDETLWFNDASYMNAAIDPRIPGCFDPNAPRFGPEVALTTQAAAPPADGFFDVTAAFVGAFRDARDTWATTGSWAVWSDR